MVVHLAQAGQGPRLQLGGGRRSGGRWWGTARLWHSSGWFGGDSNGGRSRLPGDRWGRLGALDKPNDDGRAEHADGCEHRHISLAAKERSDVHRSCSYSAGVMSLQPRAARAQAGTSAVRIIGQKCLTFIIFLEWPPASVLALLTYGFND
jgi:hypothetical protein